MPLSFSLGINQLWNELKVMQSPGLYWINVDRQIDAEMLCRQTLYKQSIDTQAALICAKCDPLNIMGEQPIAGPSRLPLYSLAETKPALKSLVEDLMRGLAPHDRLIILVLPALQWLSFSQTELDDWLLNMSQWLIKRNNTLLVINHDPASHHLRAYLASQHRTLCGLANLQWLPGRLSYDVDFWCNQYSVTARQTVDIELSEQTFTAHEVQAQNLHSASDENRYLAVNCVLEGAPALSDSWRLFNSNELLADAGAHAEAATLIFAIEESGQLITLAPMIHRLRRRQGNAIKLVVREMKATLRKNDERLLLACGANLVIPFTTQLSHFFTMLEGLKGQLFSRHVSTDITGLLEGMRPLQLKGYVDQETFCQSVTAIIDNPLIPVDSKGLLVSLRPVPGLRAAQALTLCHIRRDGDLVTLANDRLVLFLSACLVNDLDVALNSIFRLPVAETFSNQKVWYLDRQIQSEIAQLNKKQPAGSSEHSMNLAVKPSSMTSGDKHRRVLPGMPEPISLATTPLTTTS